jgi:hypothetical protein
MAGMRGACRKGNYREILASSRVCPCGTPPHPPRGRGSALRQVAMPNSCRRRDKWRRDAHLWRQRFYQNSRIYDVSEANSGLTALCGLRHVRESLLIQGDRCEALQRTVSPPPSPLGGRRRALPRFVCPSQERLQNDLPRGALAGRPDFAKPVHAGG